MNVTSLNELRAGAPQADAQDARLEKVRDLLIGDHARETEARIAELAQRIANLEGLVGQELEALASRIEAASGAGDRSRRAAFDELARHVAGLADQIRSLSKA